MHVAEQTTLQTYTLELIGPQTFSYMAALSIRESWAKTMRETEENLTDLLPPGYSVRIKEWDV